MSIHPMFHTELFQYAKQLGFGELHFKLDSQTGLFAIVAIHSTKLGPALGGCRCIEYSTIDDAILDALRLAQGMTYKAAVSHLPLGGGKAVLLKPKTIQNREAYFEAFGQFVEDLGGRYITAVDSGTYPTDMDYVARKTRHVTSTSAANGDPSPFTALGVRRAIEAAVKYRLGKDSLKDIHIAIQGVGNVGKYLVQELHALGAKLTIADSNETAVRECVEKYQAIAVHPEEIYALKCDVFAPCALGAIINDRTIPHFNTNIIIGSANNQLAEPRHGAMLRERGILYGPDYVVNAGGLIYAGAQYIKVPKEEVYRQTQQIYETTLEILRRSDKEHCPTNVMADKIAEERLTTGG